MSPSRAHLRGELAFHGKTVGKNQWRLSVLERAETAPAVVPSLRVVHTALSLPIAYWKDENTQITKEHSLSRDVPVQHPNQHKA